jgi:tetratricopeptide (TPR) repeat protein
MFKRNFSSYLACFAFALIVSVNIGYGQPSDIASEKVKIISLIESGKLAEADAATAGIIDLPDSNDKGQALQEIAGAYQQSGQFDKAIELCDYILKNWSKENFTIWAKMSLVLSQLGKSDINAANETTNSIVNECTNNPYFVWVLSIVSDGYCERRMNDNAYELRQIGIRKSPESIWGREMEILVLLNQGAYSISQKRLNSLTEDLNENSNLSEVVFRVGQEFCWKRKYSDAKGVFDRIQNLSDSSFKQKAKLWSVAANICALIRQNKDEEAASALSAMIKEFEKEGMLPEVVYRTAQEFEWTKGEVAAMSNQYNKSLSIYQQVLQSFSGSKYAKMSQDDCIRLKYRIDILSAIEKDAETEANAAIDKMSAEYAGRPELEGELYWFEGWCKDHQKLTMADSINKRRTQK